MNQLARRSALKLLILNLLLLTPAAARCGLIDPVTGAVGDADKAPGLHYFFNFKPQRTSFVSGHTVKAFSVASVYAYSI